MDLHLWDSNRDGWDGGYYSVITHSGTQLAGGTLSQVDADNVRHTICVGYEETGNHLTLSGTPPPTCVYVYLELLGSYPHEITFGACGVEASASDIMQICIPSPPADATGGGDNNKCTAFLMSPKGGMPTDTGTGSGGADTGTNSGSSTDAATTCAGATSAYTDSGAGDSTADAGVPVHMLPLSLVFVVPVHTAQGVVGIASASADTDATAAAGGANTPTMAPTIGSHYSFTVGSVASGTFSAVTPYSGAGTGEMAAVQQHSAMCIPDGCHSFIITNTTATGSGGTSSGSGEETTVGQAVWFLCGQRGTVPWSAQLCVEAAYGTFTYVCVSVRIDALSSFSCPFSLTSDQGKL